MIIQNERFRELSRKHCKTAMVVGKNLATFFGLPPWDFEGKILLFSLLEINLNIFGRFREKSVFLNLTHCFIIIYLSFLNCD